MTSKPSLVGVAVSAFNADRNGQSKNMESQCDRHPESPPLQEDSEVKPPVAVLVPLGFVRTIFTVS